MRLLWAQLDRFRNLERQKVRLNPRFNLILGSNGQGKTNLLEGLGYLGTLRSIRSASRADMVRRGEAGCLIEGEVQTGAVRHTLSVSLTARGRAVRMDDKAVPSPEQYVRALGMVSFIPEDVGLVGGPPAQRRRVIDRAVFDTGAPYAEEFRRYLRVLRQRNSLLRQRRFARAEKAGWDREYCLAGAALARRRNALVGRLNARIDRLGSRLGLPSGLRLVYAPSFPPPSSDEPGGWARAMAQHMDRIAEREAGAGHSLAGPHRDDVIFVLGGEGEGGEDLARYGSQGQKRIAVLAFKLAIAEAVREARGDWPVILLDDVASELDAPRRKALGALVRETEAQFFITTTGDDYMFLPAGEGGIWKMEAGRLTELPKGASGG